MMMKLFYLFFFFAPVNTERTARTNLILSFLFEIRVRDGNRSLFSLFLFTLLFCCYRSLFFLFLS